MINYEYILVVVWFIIFIAFGIVFVIHTVAGSFLIEFIIATVYIFFVLVVIILLPIFFTVALGAFVVVRIRVRRFSVVLIKRRIVITVIIVVPTACNKRSN